jgi:predicted anti-sigma-YlaC factor YlaD
MKLFHHNCRSVTALVVAGLDRELGFFERWIVRAHLKVCAACPRFSRQIALMREALPRWRTYRDGAD